MTENKTNIENNNASEMKQEKTLSKLARKIPLPNYSLGEELFSSISHGIGALLGLVGMILLLIKSDTTMDYFSAVFFGLSLMTLYTVSCVYHGLKKNDGKRVMRVLDHCMIYFLILGTYAPFCLISMAETNGIFTFALNCFFAMVGVTFTAIDVKKFAKLSMACYLGMGWLVILSGMSLYNSIGHTGFWFILGGGIAYTIGAVVYGIGSKLKYFHSIWHLFVLAGSILQYIAIYIYIY